MRTQRLFAAVMPLLLLAFGPAPQRQTIDLDLSSPAGGRLEIDLGSVSGEIEITGTDGDRVLINGTVSARDWRDDNEVIVDQSDDRIRLYSEYIENRGRNDDRRMRANLTLTVPRNLTIELQSAMETTLRGLGGSTEVTTANNDLVAGGLSGEVRLVVANGDLRIADSDISGGLSNTNGSLRLTRGSFHGSLGSTNGGAEIEAVSGDIEISATNGTVELGDVAGSLRARTTNGNVRAASVAGEIDIETTNGSVSATLAGNGDPVRVETLNGSVELDASADLSATFDVAVRQTQPDRERDRPEIRSDFPLDIDAGAIRGNEYRQSARGTSGAGARRIQIDATNGNVTLRSIG